MKKLLSMLLVMALMVCTLSGCAVKQTNPEGETEETAEVTETTEETTGPEETTDGEVVKAESGTLTVYTALEDDMIEGYLAPFREQYPDIELNIIRDSTGTIIAKVIAEKDNPTADVVWGVAASVLLQLENYDLIKGYTPEGADRLMEDFKDTSEPAMWTGIDAYETAFLVNTDECERLGIPVPTTMEDLIDPCYKGLIVMPDPTSSGTGMLTVNGVLQTMGDEAGWKYLKKLNDNILTYTTSGSKPAKMAASGECVVGISMGYRCAQLYQEGNPVQVIFPNEGNGGSGWEVEANCLINKDEINPCAYTFLDWAISDSAMEQYSVGYPITGIGVIGEVPEGYSKTPLENLCELDLPKAVEQRDDIIAKFEEFLVGKTE